MLKDNILDVAIVGGGVSGVYSAWRLMTSQTQKSERLEQMLSKRGEDRLKIAVFEGSHRIGGRLLSVTPPGMPNTRCELGGMRYMSSQKLVRSLVENKLKLETRPLYVSEPENIAYLRGQHLRLCQLTDPKLAPYALKSAEQGIDPSNFIGFALEQLMPGISKLHGEELRHFVRTHKFEGKHLYNWGFWNLLARSLSHEAYTLAFQAGGYDTTVLNWNAADTILLNCDFTPS